MYILCILCINLYIIYKYNIHLYFDLSRFYFAVKNVADNIRVVFKLSLSGEVTLVWKKPEATEISRGPGLGLRRCTWCSHDAALKILSLSLVKHSFSIM